VSLEQNAGSMPPAGRVPGADAWNDFAETSRAAVWASTDVTTDPRTIVARAQGVFNAIGGVWPVINIRSFEAITGRKSDKWLVKTVGLLLTVIGSVQATSRAPDGSPSSEARSLGLGTAAALLGIDLYYVARRRISKVYLLDALAQIGFIGAWYGARRRDRVIKLPA
jgi:hypothetical protein